MTCSPNALSHKPSHNRNSNQHIAIENLKCGRTHHWQRIQTKNAISRCSCDSFEPPPHRLYTNPYQLQILFASPSKHPKPNVSARTSTLSLPPPPYQYPTEQTTVLKTTHQGNTLKTSTYSKPTTFPTIIGTDTPPTRKYPLNGSFWNW